ncbi:MAG: DNA double-strand break repair nuclease NurA [Candidatus Lokiarchaeota archaeon]|nr:DNA double-strand break repair nuclease NurA [Candidatus Lokiarchaeota archaeon]
MGIHFDPFELEFIVISDSNGYEIMKFIVPNNDNLTKKDFKFLDNFHEINILSSILKVNSIIEASEILNNPYTAMDLAEYACIFENLMKDKTEPKLFMKDGLLRSKAFKHELMQNLLDILKEYPKRKLVGVAKRSKVLSLISTALRVQKVFPPNMTGYVEIPLDIERMAYKWTGKGKISKNNQGPLSYALGKLYIVKLSKRNNLLLTIEIPYDYLNNESIYNNKEINEIIGHLIKDSMMSYPILGYPQTIMRAHEKAVRCGFTGSVWKDKIIEYILSNIGDRRLSKLIRNQIFLQEIVNKGILGGI